MTLEGRTVLITGANTGIGKATAGALARQGASVYLAGRSQERTAPVIASLELQTQRKAFHFLSLDLSDLDSVAACAKDFVARGVRLDTLVLNAGIAMGRTLTRQGFEPMFGINHLGHFLFAQLLRPALEAATAPRLVTVASRAHKRVGPIDFTQLRGPGRSLSGWPEYGRSKLCNVLFTRELPRRWVGTRVNTYAVHPGVVGSDIFRAVPAVVRPLLTLGMSTPEEGCRSSVHCATAPELSHDTGKYYDEDGTELAAQGLGQDDALAARLWDVSLDLVKGWLAGGVAPRELDPAAALRQALYPVIFEAQPHTAVRRVAALLRGQRPADQCAALASELRAGLAAHGHELRALLPGMVASEGDLGAFVLALAEALEAPG